MINIFHLFETLNPYIVAEFKISDEERANGSCVMIFVNCGQCGNQLGYELLGSLWDHLEDSNDENEVYFRTTKRDKKYARVVCLDTEPKVVSQCLAQSSVSDQRWMFDPNNIVYRHGGAGNNWATGSLL